MTTPPEEYRTIPLTQGQVALVSSEDYDRISRFRWHAAWNKEMNSYYAARYVPAITVGRFSVTSMHREVLGLTIGDSRKVDHVNPDETLDNRRSNLRIATIAENNRNRGKLTTNTSGFKGCVFERKRNKWRATISFNSKRIHIGRYPTVEAAHAAYCAAALKYHGKFARFE